MSPALAFFLTIAFVVTVLVHDHIKYKDFSQALWIPTLWLIYTTSKQIGVWLNIETTMEAGSPPDRIFLIILGVLAIIVLSKRKLNIPVILKNEPVFALLIVYMFLSIFWARSPEISLRRFLRDFIGIMVVFLVASEKDPIEAVKIIFRRAIFIFLPFSLMLIKFFPNLGRQYSIAGELMWTGMAPQKNELALFCAFSLLFLVWSLIANGIKKLILEDKIYVLISLIMIGLAVYMFLGPRRSLVHSATSLIALLLGFLVLTIPFLKKSIIYSGILLFFIVFGTIIPFLGKVKGFEWVPSLLGRTETLTGRIIIWNALVPFAKKKLLFGHGYGGFWTTSLRQTIAVTAHNGYLDTILNLGIVGLLLFVAFIKKMSAKIYDFKNESKEISGLTLSFLMMLAVHNVGESSLSYFSIFPFSLILIFFQAISISNKAIITIEKS